MTTNSVVSMSESGYDKTRTVINSGEPQPTVVGSVNVVKITFSQPITSEFHERLLACMPRRSFLGISWKYRDAHLAISGEAEATAHFEGKLRRRMPLEFMTNVICLCNDLAEAS